MRSLLVALLVLISVGSVRAEEGSIRVCPEEAVRQVLRASTEADPVLIMVQANPPESAPPEPSTVPVPPSEEDEPEDEDGGSLVPS
jgi:hypothetical protein